MLQRLTSSLSYLRPRSLARTRKAVDDLAADTRELRQVVRALSEANHGAAADDGSGEPVAAQLGAIRRDVAEIRRLLETVAKREGQLRAIARADSALDRYIDDLPSILDEARIAAHVRASIGGAQLHLEPFPYVIVENLFPGKFYDALIRGLPSPELFDGRVNKQQMVVPFPIGPDYGRRVWRFMTNIADRVVAPIVAEKFREPLAEWMAIDWPMLAGGDAPPIDIHASEGRIMLRSRGYTIQPHRDPKWGFITCLMYLVRPGDSESWGTSLYSVEGDEEAVGALPHWVPPARCRLEREVPFAANSALIFLNSKGAHGATIPDDAEPADLQRYAYQFRIGPTRAAMTQMMALLPEQRRTAWAGKISGY